ncbi:hypothetical protein HNQ36_001067 [Afipia massiliensis]|uniref:Uncharacterized protein n=1 Tax=Afipia massiliensis TaxID=211460 RepID=A0A840MT43_9BRAD|nr:hypothetical protein [Afipia massiliensis]MBB5051113.1 hypothetical protein [Afipia massiliensis]
MSSWIWWLIGTFGFAGMVYFCVAFPLTAVLVGKAIAGFIRHMLQTRVGVAILVAVLATIATWIWRDGVLDERWAQRYADDKALAATASKARDDQIAEDLTKKYQPKIQSLEQLSKSLQKQVADYAKRKPVLVAGKTVTASSCQLGDAAGWLRSRSASSGSAAAR